jgi:hypothetical protein
MIGFSPRSGKAIAWDAAAIIDKLFPFSILRLNKVA